VGTPRRRQLIAVAILPHYDCHCHSPPLIYAMMLELARYTCFATPRLRHCHTPVTLMLRLAATDNTHYCHVIATHCHVGYDAEMPPYYEGRRY